MNQNASTHLSKLIAVSLYFVFLSSLSIAQEKLNHEVKTSTLDFLSRVNLVSDFESKRLDSIAVASNKKVDSIYFAITKEYANDTAFVHHFKTAHELWKLLKRADLDTQFPERSRTEPITAYYGQVVVDCMSMLVHKTNEERIKYMTQWLKGIPEGDVCRGSIKMTK